MLLQSKVVPSTACVNIMTALEMSTTSNNSTARVKLTVTKIINSAYSDYTTLRWNKLGVPFYLYFTIRSLFWSRKIEHETLKQKI